MIENYRKFLAICHATPYLYHRFSKVCHIRLYVLCHVCLLYLCPCNIHILQFFGGTPSFGEVSLILGNTMIWGTHAQFLKKDKEYRHRTMSNLDARTKYVLVLFVNECACITKVMVSINNFTVYHALCESLSFYLYHIRL